MAVYLSRGVEWCSLTGGVCLVFGGQGVRGDIRGGVFVHTHGGEAFLIPLAFYGKSLLLVPASG